MIESKTNEKIRKRTEDLTKHKEHFFDSWIKPTNIFELRGLIDRLYFHGVFRMNHHSLNILFFDKTGPPVFSATMSRDRKKFLLSTLTFDDPESRMILGHMIVLQLHLEYLKSSILTHLNTCYIHCIYRLMKHFTS